MRDGGSSPCYLEPQHWLCRCSIIPRPPNLTLDAPTPVPGSSPSSLTMISRILIVSPLAGVLVRRSVGYWTLVHVAHKAVTAGMAMTDGARVSPERFLPGGNPLIVALVVVLGVLEVRRRNEDLFLANLGYGSGARVAYMALPAAVLEAAFTAGRFGWPMLAAYGGLPFQGLRALLTPW